MPKKMVAFRRSLLSVLNAIRAKHKSINANRPMEKGEICDWSKPKSKGKRVIVDSTAQLHAKHETYFDNKS